MVFLPGGYYYAVLWGSNSMWDMTRSLWLKVDLRSKCEFLNTSHLLIEGYILEIGHGMTEYSLTIYLTTKKISATSERAHAHRSQKGTCAAVFSRARLFSHSNMHCRDYAWKDKILNDHLSDNNKKFQPHRNVHMRTGAKNVRPRAAATFVM